MTGALGKNYLTEYARVADPIIDSYLKAKISEASKIGTVPAELLSRFHKTARLGKKLRGALIVLGYQIAGGTDIDAIYDASIFIELLHSGILVHDDIMDEGDLRRGLPSIHKQYEKIGRLKKVNSSPELYGASMAICVADAAFYLSWEKLISSRFDSKVLINAGKIYSEFVLRLVHGQVLDVTNTSLRDFNDKDILKILRYKAAEYTGVLPLILGMTLAGVKNEKKKKAAWDYGLAFGWAFQIQDDILGLYGKEEEFGKPVGSDLTEGKNTLLVRHLYEHGTESQKKALTSVLGNRSARKDEVVRVCEILKKAGSYDYVYKLGWTYVEKGKKAIPTITKNKVYHDILESLIVLMMERSA